MLFYGSIPWYFPVAAGCTMDLDSVLGTNGSRTSCSPSVIFFPKLKPGKIRSLQHKLAFVATNVPFVDYSATPCMNGVAVESL